MTDGWDDVEDLLYPLDMYVCVSCKNRFFTEDMGEGLNDPVGCPYCLIEFNKTIDCDGGCDGMA